MRHAIRPRQIRSDRVRHSAKICCPADTVNRINFISRNSRAARIAGEPASGTSGARFYAIYFIQRRKLTFAPYSLCLPINYGRSSPGGSDTHLKQRKRGTCSGRGINTMNNQRPNDPSIRISHAPAYNGARANYCARSFRKTNPDGPCIFQARRGNATRNLTRRIFPREMHLYSTANSSCG